MSTCAWTLTSSADTGSSQMISVGSRTSDRAIEMRWHWPPENWCGLALGGPCRVDADLLQRAVDELAALLLEPRFQIVSGSITMSRTLRRGFSDEIGSWKIICIRVRASRMSFVRHRA